MSHDARVAAEQYGLYAGAQEHDACGVGFIAHIKGRKSHEVVTQGLKILENLDHRFQMPCIVQKCNSKASSYRQKVNTAWA
jgi:hypothetical protein